jgi:hypothetical protein
LHSTSHWRSWYGSASGSVSKRYGSEDPHPYQNVTDTENCLKYVFDPTARVFFKIITNVSTCTVTNVYLHCFPVSERRTAINILRAEQASDPRSMSGGCAVVRQAVCGHRSEGCRTAAALPASRLAASNVPWTPALWTDSEDCRPGQIRNNLSGSDIFGIIPGVICSVGTGKYYFFNVVPVNWIMVAEIRIIWEDGNRICVRVKSWIRICIKVKIPPEL